MATRYRLKRAGDVLVPQRQFSVLDAAGNIVGGGVKAAGDVMKSGLGQTVGAVGGAMLGKSLIKNSVGGLLTGGHIGAGLLANGVVGSAIGLGAGALLGAKLMKGAGKALHNAGNSLGA